jgi:hypothetical protein
MRGKGSPYEVRCPRCDVSFPVETRRCVHCGGPTSASASPPSIEFATGGPIPGTSPQETSTGKSGRTSAPEAGPLEVPEEAPSSLGSTLLRTFGSLFWVIALIGFSIMRSCSEG